MSPTELLAEAAASAPAFEQRLEEALVRHIGAPRYQLWFQQHTKFVLQGDRVVVGVPNLHFQEWLSKTFGDAVKQAAGEVLGRPLPVRFVIDPELFRAAREEQEKVGSAKTGPEAPTPDADLFDSPAPRTKVRPAQAEEREPLRAPRSALRAPKRRFRRLEDFVVGPCNRVAYAAAQSAVEEFGQGPNPLVLHGPVGTGKTHLLEGIYVGLRKNYGDARLCFVTAEDFTNRFVQAMRVGKQASFRKQFRECAALLLDDLHFLATKRATQEEFLHTFDALLSDGRPVFVTCDCHPRLAEEFLPELTDRLLGGAIWGMLPPDADTRLDLLRSKAGAASPSVPEEVLKFLARQLRGNVRELEGALHSLRHFGRVTGRSIDLALAREALGELLRHAVRVVRVEDVDAAVCGVLRLPAGTLQAQQRAWAVSHPRMLAIFLCRKHTAATYGEISKHFGGKSHSTAVAAEKKVRQWLQTNGSLTLGGREWGVRELVERVERELQR